MTDTVGGSDPDPDIDAQFAKLLRDMEAGRPARVHEPSARVRMLQNMWREYPAPTAPWRDEWPAFGDAAAEAGNARRGRYRRRRAALRVWPRRTATAVIICALAFAVVETTRARSKNTAAKPAVNVAVNARQPTPTSTVHATVGATRSAANDVIPLTQLFPGTVPAANGSAYTLLQSGNLADCIKSDLVGAKLAGLFAQSNGCVAGEEALYKDEANDQFNVVVFTLKDPADTVRIMNDLAMDDTDFEVAPQVPPDGSGLQDLSADNDIVQLFASDGDRMAVFMAQWADGRTSDDEDLERLLTPLQDAIGRSLSAGGSASR